MDIPSVMLADSLGLLVVSAVPDYAHFLRPVPSCDLSVRTNVCLSVYHVRVLYQNE